MKLKKRAILLIGLFGVIVFLASVFNRELGICGAKDWGCWDMLEYPWMLGTFFIPLFVFSLVTYFMQEQIFQSWRKTTFIFFGIFLILFLISPRHPDSMSPIPSKEVVVWYVVGLYSLFSTSLLAVKSWKLKKTHST